MVGTWEGLLVESLLGFPIGSLLDSIWNINWCDNWLSIWGGSLVVSSLLLSLSFIPTLVFGNILGPGAPLGTLPGSLLGSPLGLRFESKANRCLFSYRCLAYRHMTCSCHGSTCVGG